MNANISANFPYESKYIEILGSKMHYIEEGEGDPILFVHGNPTSNYIWRNIIPYLKNYGRSIAPDLIGMGKSGKPDIHYGFFDSYRYLEAFINALGLKNVTLVLHDWGSIHGFHYANLHRENIKGIAFMESLYKGLEKANMPLLNKVMFSLMRTKGLGSLMVKHANLFLQSIPQLVKRKLSKEELMAYSAPFKTTKSRTPLLQFIEEAPIDGSPQEIAKIVNDYFQWMQENQLPKLLLYATPGASILEKDVKWLNAGGFQNLKVVSIGEGLHFVQEDNPHSIGQELVYWINENNFLKSKHYQLCQIQ